MGAAMMLGFRLSDLPADALNALPPDLRLPWWTAISALLMLAVVAGVTEEVGVRGYLQGSVEDAGFPIFAVIYSSVVFTLLHANKAWFVEQAVPMFLAATWYGYLTLRTQSIYPMILIHTALDAILFLRFTMLRADLPSSVHETGYSTAFWLNLLAVAVLGPLAFTLTSRIPSHTRSGRSDPIFGR